MDSKLLWMVTAMTLMAAPAFLYPASATSVLVGMRGSKAAVRAHRKTMRRMRKVSRTR